MEHTSSSLELQWLLPKRMLWLALLFQYACLGYVQEAGPRSLTVAHTAQTTTEGPGTGHVDVGTCGRPISVGFAGCRCDCRSSWQIWTAQDPTSWCQLLAVGRVQGMYIQILAPAVVEMLWRMRRPHLDMHNLLRRQESTTSDN